MKPLLFLDVDGVINVSGTTPNATNVGLFEGRYPIHLPAGIEERIARLQEAYEIIWATTWREKAHPYYRELLGLPEEPWPAIDFDVCKLPSVVSYAADFRRPFAWVDDESGFEFTQYPELRDKPGITITPRWTEGLTDEHVTALLTYAGELADG